MFKVTFTRPSDSEPTVIFHARHDDALFTADQVRSVFRVAATVAVSEGEAWARILSRRTSAPFLSCR